MILSTMCLNECSKAEMRELIEHELKLVPDSKKVKLDKDLLEDLLFLQIKDGDKLVKLPIWSGMFLKKLDLSEVDFNDVSYAILYNINVDKSEDSPFFDLIKKRTRRYNLATMVYYGNTNANIDFKKSYEYKNTGKIIIHGCNFNGTDLSNNDINEEFNIIHGYFKDTGLKISTLRNSSCAKSSDFSSVDLSYCEVTMDEIANDSMIFKNSCTLRDTGINILLSDSKKEDIRIFWDKYYNGDFCGCFFNGVMIKPEPDARNNMLSIKRQYDNEVDELKTHVKKMIKPYKDV